MSYKRKLIEVSLPLEVINRESAREKSIRHGHPSTLHLWWARRPLAAARAVLFAQLVDDPSSHPDKFPTEEDQKRERARLHGIIERLVVWENIRDEKLLAEAHEEILKSTDGQPAGDPRSVRRRWDHPARGSAPRPGGARLRPQPGRRADQQGADRDPAEVSRTSRRSSRDWPSRRSGSGTARRASLPTCAPTAVGCETRPSSGSAIYTRQAGRARPSSPGSGRAPSPARTPHAASRCRLVRTWWLGKKKGKEAYVVPIVVADASQLQRAARSSSTSGTTGRRADGEPTERFGRPGRCVRRMRCRRSPSTTSEPRGVADRMRQQLMAVVAEGNRRRIYLAPAPTDRSPRG